MEARDIIDREAKRLSVSKTTALEIILRPVKDIAVFDRQNIDRADVLDPEIDLRSVVADLDDPDIALKTVVDLPADRDHGVVAAADDGIKAVHQYQRRDHGTDDQQHGGDYLIYDRSPDRALTSIATSEELPLPRIPSSWIKEVR